MSRATPGGDPASGGKESGNAPKDGPQPQRPLKIAMVGTRGVPARYGGFETAVEEVGSRLASSGHDVIVYCRNRTQVSASYRGMRLVRLPALRQKSLETLSHTALSVAHASIGKPDAAVVFNSANAVFLPLLRARRIPVAVHVDGLEWRRAKWGPWGRRYYLAMERLAARWADALIADARGIADHFEEKFGVATTYLPYGAPILHAPDADRLRAFGLSARGYHLVVARFEPENHVDLIIEGYIASRAQHPLVVVGSASYSRDHDDRITELAERDPRVRLLGGVWDQELLDALYANAASYVHGHSVGGTNPSLLRAMGAGAPVVAYDVSFNREVLGGDGRFFADSQELSTQLGHLEGDRMAKTYGLALRDRAAELYRWDDVATGYEQLCMDLASGLQSRSMQRPSRRAK